MFVVWELVCMLGNISKTVLPAPSDIFQALVTYRDLLLIHTVQTVEEALIGLFVAVLLGVSIAVILFLFPRVRAAVYPLLVISQTIPMIALAPLLLIWFGFDLFPKVIVVVLYCFFPIAIAVTDALHAADQNTVDLLKSMRATKWQILKFVRLPSSLLAFFSGLRISATYAIGGAIVGEYVGAYRGLGVFMQTSANGHAIDLVFAALVIIAAISTFFLGLVSVAERIFTPWKNVYE
ncbi:nitrate ABC transporter permease [Candidatus Kaiserbacteria bacterium RIFCSPLOWO2_12_FULL_53_8]|uniref:Nitrate ABC transporter permease n=1 Tax=Candidatus Kaiserbacteria bacterium RIFCSPLOWO2_12_FULL_53_8 TaxID=1798529 RepID=A0A1F6G0G5_9BACT|nr:MAG: nitrate ABC transporter permease [Candidatus Kaiserbacteria bacterium RIFCSPLOWO2_12_FULL_53_8]